MISNIITKHEDRRLDRDVGDNNSTIIVTHITEGIQTYTAFRGVFFGGFFGQRIQT